MGAVRKDLTRNLGRMQPNITDDVRFAIDSAMGLDTDSWKELCISEAMEGLALRSTNRVLVGSCLCENDDYLRYSHDFAT